MNRNLLALLWPPLWWCCLLARHAIILGAIGSLIEDRSERSSLEIGRAQFCYRYDSSEPTNERRRKRIGTSLKQEIVDGRGEVVRTGCFARIIVVLSLVTASAKHWFICEYESIGIATIIPSHLVDLLRRPTAIIAAVLDTVLFSDEKKILRNPFVHRYHCCCSEEHLTEAALLTYYYCSIYPGRAIMTSSVRRSILEVLFPVSTPTTTDNETTAGKEEEEGILDDDDENNKARKDDDACSATPLPPSAPSPADGGALILERMEEGGTTNGDATSYNKNDDFSIDMNNNNNNNDKLNNKLCSICLERLGTYLCLAVSNVMMWLPSSCFFSPCRPTMIICTRYRTGGANGMRPHFPPRMLADVDDDG
jgi:hypothetical protein